jgi:RNA polymerase sigma-B factor
LAVAAGVPEEHLLRAMDVGCCRRASSLEAVLSAGADGCGSDGWGRDDPALAAFEWREVLDGAMARLPEPEQAVILHRFIADASQYETARRLSISRTEVARLERRGLARLRRLIL